MSEHANPGTGIPRMRRVELSAGRAGTALVLRSPMCWNGPLNFMGLVTALDLGEEI